MKLRLIKVEVKLMFDYGEGSNEGVKIDGCLDDIRKYKVGETYTVEIEE